MLGANLTLLQDGHAIGTGQILSFSQHFPFLGSQQLHVKGPDLATPAFSRVLAGVMHELRIKGKNGFLTIPIF